MNDDKLLEKIKQSADSCEIPDELKPEKLEEKLEDNAQPKILRKHIYQMGTVAAILIVLILGVGIPALTQRTDPSQDNTAAVESEELADSENAVFEEGVKELGSMYKQASDYDEVYAAMEPEQFNYDDMNMDAATSGSETTESTSMRIEEAAMDVAAEAGGASGGYSTTNLQVEGVDEGDIVKTDGKYIYIIHENRLIRIVAIDGANMQEIAAIRLEQEQSEETIQEIYLTDNTLNIISQGYSNGLEQKDKDTYYMNYRSFTSVYTYDITNREDPKRIGHVSQDGNYNTSRKVGDFVYLFTDFNNHQAFARGTDEQGTDSQEAIPQVNAATLEPSDIYLPIQPKNTGYMVISSIDMKNPDQIVDKKAIMENATQFYITTENIYIQTYNWNYGGENTGIAKFHFEKGKITGESAALIRGSITDSFAINEYKGCLRVLTTDWSGSESINYVYVLDEKMNITGKIEGLAKGESIYAARFMEDTGYFVTYRQVDPLFSVDFSDPKNPKILGELKITGFSEYLHFYGKNQLLGMGWETDPESGERIGFKLSMFDVSNPADVREIDKKVIKNIDDFPGEYNYKALTVDAAKNVIGFLTSTYTERDTGHSYMVFSYDQEKGFSNHLSYTFSSDNAYSWGNENTRGLYVDDTFYVVNGSKITAFDMKDNYKKSGELIK